MKAAIVRAIGEAPIYAEVAEPLVSPGEQRVTVTAAAVSHVTRSRASGTHYSASGEFPFVIGIDGVGRLDNGKRVYFVLPEPPNGGMAERTAVADRQCVPLPGDLDDATAAAIANPGVSSWAAFTERAKLKRGETVLINGATGTAGRLAVQIAKYLGAGKVIATGRNAGALRSLAALGADVTIPLVDDADALEESVRPHFAAGVDVVIDYLWGVSAERLLIAGAKAGADDVPIRFVEVGSASSQTITLPSAVLRSSAIQMMGSGLGSVPPARMLACITDLLKAAPKARLTVATSIVPLSKIEAVWAQDDGGRRTVLVPDSVMA
ncbi:MAG TPA: zinc-binding alcohol dehydrogenase family protein [Bauldia sp.]|nr:zinc-binding alcohol dehydrogenase family protein [Bauldia sp.]